MSGIQSLVDNFPADLGEYGEEENDFDFDTSAYFKNLKIGDYDLDQIDQLVQMGEADL